MPLAVSVRYEQKEDADMNRVTLRKSDITVERDLLRLRAKFLDAIMPSKPNSF